ncbi:MAG: hypothetical protein HYT77_05770 [Deltaproteobacteria bacterium]|nr:hypothetical protein [Deltaproteobacteria bacterium]
MWFKKTPIFLAMLMLVTACASKRIDPTTKPSGAESESSEPDDPAGTIIGNPAPQPGKLKITAPDGRTRYLIEILANGEAEATLVNASGDNVEKVKGNFSRISSAASLSSLSLEAEVTVADAQRFEMTILFSDGSELHIVLTTDENSSITGIAVEVNDVEVMAQVEFTEEDGEVRQITLLIEDRPRVCLSLFDTISTAAEEAYEQGMENLSQGLIRDAKESFEQAITESPRLAEAHFGLALTQLMLLPETPAGLGIQDGFGQERFTIDDFFGPGSWLEDMNEWRRNGSVGERPGRERFPWSDTSEEFNLGQLFALAQNGYTTEEFQEGLRGIRSELDTVIDHLEAARLCNDFEFTVPGQLFYSSRSIPVNWTDLTLLTAGQYSTQFGLSLFNGWRFDVDLGSLFDEEGDQEISNMALVDQMNNFFRLRDSSEFTTARQQLLTSLQLILEALEAMPTAPAFGVIEDSPAVEAGLDQILRIAQAAQDSFGGVVTLPGTLPVITVDLSSLFSSPPTLESIGIEPFVLEDGEIHLVEAFFTTMIDRFSTGISDGEIGSFRLLNLMTPEFIRNLFDEVNGMRLSEGI